MVIENIDEMKDYITKVIAQGMRLQNIEMDEDLSIFLIIIGEENKETRTAYFGFDESLHRKIAIEVLKADDSQIQIFGG